MGGTLGVLEDVWEGYRISENWVYLSIFFTLKMLLCEHHKEIFIYVFTIWALQVKREKTFYRHTRSLEINSSSIQCPESVNNNGYSMDIIMIEVAARDVVYQVVSLLTHCDFLCFNLLGITDDLIVLFKAFLETYTVFQNIPFYIFCESYGGKYTSSFGVALLKAIQAGSIKCNFRGVALGDSWISPVDSVLSWGPYLYALSQLDDKDLKQVNAAAQATAHAVASGQYAKATQLWDETENVIEKTTDHVDIYNVLKHYSPPFPQLKSTGETTLDSLYARHVGRLYEDPLTALMNGPIRDKLGIIPCNVTWGGQSADVFKYQSEDFMKPVISDVSELLQYGMKVVIYQGQLDIICGTLGAEVWIAKLDWDGLADFLKTDRVPLYPPSGMKDRNTGAFYKAYKNLELYYIMKAGHMVPTDNGEMALEMVKRIID